MENRILKYFLCFILAIILFISEILLIVQYNTSRGITKENMDKVIDNISIENEIVQMDDYKELEEQINPEILQQIIESNELNNYIKGNAKALYGNILYNENNKYVNSEELKQFINNLVTEQQETLELTEEEIELINIKIDNITKKIDESIEDVKMHKSDMEIISKIVSKKTTTYILTFTILIGAAIIIINKSKDGYIFTGITTLIVGVIFFIIWLTLSRKITTTGIDDKIIKYIEIYLPTLLKTLKKSSVIMSLIGLLECIIYTILHYQEVQSDGKI